jgi:hypothetical protein
MRRALALTTMLVAAPVGGGPSANRPRHPFDFSAESVAVETVRNYLPRGPVRLEPRVWKNGAWTAARDSMTVRGLARALHASTLVSIDSVYVCPDSARPATCRLEGSDPVIEVDEPVIHGDSAHVVVRTWRRVESPYVPVGLGLYEFLLARQSGQWQVSSARVSVT